MPVLRSLLIKSSPVLLSIIRIIIALLFMEHGAQKLFGFPAPMEGGNADLLSLSGLAGVLEFFGGLLILLGLFTRPVAFILSGEMAFAYIMVHSRMGFWPLLNHGELAAVYCFIYLYLIFSGPGPISLDYLINKARK